MLMMRDEIDVMCCKSVGTDLSMLDIDDLITEISQLKKEVALLEAKLRSRGDEGLKREDVARCCESSVYVTDGCLDSVWISRDQSRTPQPQLDSKLSEEKSRNAQDSKLSLTLLCYTESKPTDDQEDTALCNSNHQVLQEDQTSTESLVSVCCAGEEQQILQTTPKMCSVKLIDCRKMMMEIKTETTAEEHHTDVDDNYDDGHDFIPSDEKRDSNFNTLQEKKLHSEEHSKKKAVAAFHCELCDKVYLCTSLKPHMRTHTNEKPFHCAECGKYFRSKQNLDAHQKIHTGEKPYECPHCEKRFNHKPHLKKHVRSHTDERPYQCGECERRFRVLSCLKSHQKTHSGKKLFQCSHCSKRFGLKAHLIVHERIHTGEKPYVCPHCGKSFADPSHFRVHLRVHTGEKPYRCNVCGRRFRQREHFVNHQRTHTGERLYKCSQCDRTFARSDVLKTHERVHTGEKPYRCLVCGERFTYLKTLNTHQKKH